MPYLIDYGKALLLVINSAKTRKSIDLAASFNGQMDDLDRMKLHLLEANGGESLTGLGKTCCEAFQECFKYNKKEFNKLSELKKKFREAHIQYDSKVAELDGFKSSLRTVHKLKNFDEIDFESEHF